MHYFLIVFKSRYCIIFVYRKEKLKETFGTYGYISSIYYPVNLKTYKTLGFAFVRFLEENDAMNAQESMNGSEVLGCTITVDFHKQERYFSKPKITGPTPKPPKNKTLRSYKFDL